jgi:hypothetical protein
MLLRISSRTGTSLVTEDSSDAKRPSKRGVQEAHGRPAYRKTHCAESQNNQLTIMRQKKTTFEMYDQSEALLKEIQRDFEKLRKKLLK